MPSKPNFRTVEGVPETTARLQATIAQTRPLAALLIAAERQPLDERTANEMVLLLQCLNDLMERFGLDMETTTARFKRWAVGSSRSWWTLYQAAMQGDKHAGRQMEREVS